MGGGSVNDATGGTAQTIEIDFLCSLTRNFSDSFQIKRERVTNWRLMGILMDLEKGGSVAASSLRKAIKPLTPGPDDPDSLYPWANKFVKQFENSEGGFLNRVARPAASANGKNQSEGKGRRKRAHNTVSYELNDNFKKCARNYVSILLNTYGDEFNISYVELTDDQAHRAFKTIFKFQTENYCSRPRIIGHCGIT